jgi:hypothetical protein
MARLGQLLIELAMNTARLQTDAGKAIGIVEKAASRIKTAFKFAGGGLIGAALANTVKQSIQFGDEIAKAATKAGLGSRAMSELAYAAKLADIDIASLSTALRKMQVSLSEAGTGAKGPTMALDALGLKIEDILKNSPDAQFELIAERISQLKEPADRARAATELFGKAGADLLPLFEQGAEGIRKAREEAEKLGLSFSDAQIQGLANADAAVKRLEASWSGFATTMVSKVAPNFAWTLDRLAGKPLDLAERVANQEDLVASIKPRRGYFNYAADLEREKKKLEELRRLLKEESMREMGVGATGNGSVSIGYAAVKSAEDAKNTGKKARESELKDLAEVAKRTAERVGDQISAMAENARAEAVGAATETAALVDAAAKAQEEFAKRQRELAEERQRETERLGELLDDQLMNAFKRGKEGWKDMLDYWVTQLAFSGINQLFGGLLGKGDKTLGGGLAEIFSGGGLGDGGGGMGIAQGEWDWLKKIGGFGGGLFGSVGKIFGFANGGRPPLDRPSVVGERGPELFWPDGAGAVIPGGMGGNVSIAPVYNIDARGASADLIKALPQILRDNNDALEARFVTRLRRNHYGL